MARSSNGAKSHSCVVKFSTVEDVALYERIEDAAKKARRDVSDEIVMALEQCYPETAEEVAVN